MTTETLPFRRLYVWEWPVRFFHWVNAACVVVLGTTGLIIGNPPALGASSEAYQQYWFGTVRFVHFTAAFVFIAALVFRIYWGFVGNQYARWKAFIPYNRERLREMWEIARVDILLVQDPRRRISVGHNALAGIIYLFTFLVFLFQVATGLALYSAMSDWFVPRMFAWVVPLMGGEFGVRQWHHMALWYFVVFTLIHVYLVVYHDYVESRGTVSSMVSGLKFVRKRGESS
ncbi:MAG: Ni/Fe-hydrogenase, b-type cytochrome subunit [Planctomycetota bacterium]|jgi:Ni/Fe-hydrogenase 1 B-type cytochrome subunit